MEHVQLHRDYYDLSDPGFLDRAKHKLRVHGRKLVEIVTSVLIHSGLDLAATHEVLLKLNGYGNADRYRALSQWFVQRRGFTLPKVSETAVGAQRSN